MAILPLSVSACLATGIYPGALLVAYFATSSAHDDQHRFVHLVLSGLKPSSGILKIRKCLFGKGVHLFHRGRNLFW